MLAKTFARRSVFFRLFRHLFPDAEAWRMRDPMHPWNVGEGFTVGEPGLFIGGRLSGKVLERFVWALTFVPAEARDFLDGVLLSLFPRFTPVNRLKDWEQQFGLPVGSDDDEEDSDEAETRRQQIAAEWRATGGQDPHYIQDVLQTAGFDVFVHEWWESGPDPWVARDPRDHTETPRIGTVQCTDEEHRFSGDQPQCAPFGMQGQPQCNNFLANEPGYIVNLDLTRRPPPFVPDDPARWRFFIYIGAETFPEKADVPAARRAELERLVLKLRPKQQWVVMLVNYV